MEKQCALLHLLVGMGRIDVFRLKSADRGLTCVTRATTLLGDCLHHLNHPLDGFILKLSVLHLPVIFRETWHRLVPTHHSCHFLGLHVRGEPCLKLV